MRFGSRCCKTRRTGNTAGTQAERDYLHQQNLELNRILSQYAGGVESGYDPATGRWTTENADLGYGDIDPYDRANAKRLYGGRMRSWTPICATRIAISTTRSSIRCRIWAGMARKVRWADPPRGTGMVRAAMELAVVMAPAVTVLAVMGTAAMAPANFPGCSAIGAVRRRPRPERQIDYATAQGVAALERAREDAAAQYQTQRIRPQKYGRNAMDNAAL